MSRIITPAVKIPPNRLRGSVTRVHEGGRHAIYTSLPADFANFERWIIGGFARIWGYPDRVCVCARCNPIQ